MSSFNIGLSGLGAAATDLDVTANNIANSATHGFKESRAEFADVYATSIFSNPSTAVGSGVTVAAVTQQFQQGNLEFTNNSLDMGITGEGFFILQNDLGDSTFEYSRAGAFQVDADGYVVNSHGQYLQTFPMTPGTDNVSSVSMTTLEPLRIDTSTGAPQATKNVELELNLNSGAPAFDGTHGGGTGNTAILDTTINVATATATPIGGTFPVGGGTDYDAVTLDYNYSTSINAYDSLGNPHRVVFYFTKDDPAISGSGNPPNTWLMNAFIDTGGVDATGQPVYERLTDNGTYPLGTPVTFTASGQLDTVAGAAASTLVLKDTQYIDDVTGANNFDAATAPITLDLTSETTQYAAASAVKGLSQDGLQAGRLTGINIDESGLVQASYSNGSTEFLGKVAMASFDNPQGLRPVGNTNWVESLASGEVLPGEAKTGRFGQIKSGALEQSNVDLTEQLVHLIIAQRNYQANAKTIETANAINQTIINLR